MSNFKLKIVIGDAQIELEGDGELVHAIFQEVKDNGLGKLIPVQPKSQSDTQAGADSSTPPFSETGEGGDMENSADKQKIDLPSIQNVVLQCTPKKESEWVLIYALYASNCGQKLFTRDDLRSKYEETNRVTASHNAHFGENIKSLVSSKYISAVNESDFRIERAGIDEALRIIAGNSSNGAEKKSTPSRKRPPSQYKMVELSLSDQDKKSFREYWASHTHVATMDKAVLIAYWLKSVKGIEAFTADLFFTMLRTAGESVNFKLEAAISNAKIKKSFFTSGQGKGTYVLYHLGEDRVKELSSKN